MKALLVLSFLFLNLSAHASECKVYIAEATKCTFDTQDGCVSTFEDTSAAKKLNKKGYTVVQSREEAEFELSSSMSAEVLWLNEGVIIHSIDLTDLKTNKVLYINGMGGNLSLTVSAKLATRRAWNDLPACSELK